jgi:MYXO-CTERM domain-containing protein
VKVLPFTGQPDDSGCGCRSFSAAQGAWWLLALLAPLLMRRRRARTEPTHPR